MNILAVYGATHRDSLSKTMIEIVGASAEQQGAQVTYINLLELDLPVFRVDQDFSENDAVKQIRQLTSKADGFILGTPEYHGCMSNWMKNYFDYHWKEFGGKLFALIASTGGGVATSCLQQMRIAVQHCHGWSLPYHTSVTENEFDKASGQIQAPRLIERLECTGRDLVAYGQVLQGQFQAELEGPKSNAGFAAWYHKGDKA